MAEQSTPKKEITSEDLPKKEITSEELHGYIKQTVNKLGPNVSKEQKKEYAKLMVKIFEKGMSPKDAMEISDEMVAQIYSYAYSKFSAGHYSDARELFKVMLSLEPLNADFATALGICHHKLKDYEYALYCYMLGTFLDLKSPVCLFYAYDCYASQNNDVAAGVMLCNVIARCGSEPMYDHIRNDAQVRLAALEKRLVEGQAAMINNTAA